MSIDMEHAVDRPPVSVPAAGTGPRGPLAWQRTDTVGTELVFPAGAENRSADGSAVLAGPLPHTTRFHAELDAAWAVRALTVTCSGGDWTRTLSLTRETDGAWACRAHETGDLGRSPAGSGHPTPQMPGIDDPARLHGAAIIRLDHSPVFITWALRHLELAPGDEPRTVPTIRVLTPSLVVLPTLSTYQLISEHRLRIGGHEPTALYDLDRHGVVTYQPARLRLVR